MLADSPIVKRWSKPFDRSVVAMITLAVGLILGIVVIALPLKSAGVVAENEDTVQLGIDARADTAEREADFYRLDHELMFFGPSALASAAEEREAHFYRLDHELMFFGPSAPASTAEERGADFYRLDHELMFFGPSAPASAAEERGADFYRLDHELMFFGRSAAE